MRQFVWWFFTATVWLIVTPANAVAQVPEGAAAKLLLQSAKAEAIPPWFVPSVSSKKIDDTVGFKILVWQFKTNAVRDAKRQSETQRCGCLSLILRVKPRLMVLVAESL